MSLPLKNLTILVVDDEADDCEDLRSLLEKSGASVMVARSVEDALELQRKDKSEYRGFTPAIAITSFASHADKERALMAGFNAYVPKSIEPACIVDAITRVLGDSTDLAA